VPGGAAGPPATGSDDGVDPQVRELILRLPWRERAQQLGRAAEASLSQLQVQELGLAMTAQIRAGAVSFDLTREVALAALVEARSNLPRYVRDAFTAGKLPTWVGRVTMVPLSADPLPLPASATPVESLSLVKTPRGGAKSPSAVVQRVSPYRDLPACVTCGAEAGAPLGHRMLDDENYRPERLCPDCGPAAQRARAKGLEARAVGA
jgi:hypothetical protein